MRKAYLLFFSVLYNSEKQPFKKYLFVCICATAHVFFLFAAGISGFPSSFSHETVGGFMIKLSNKILQKTTKSQVPYMLR